MARGGKSKGARKPSKNFRGKKDYQKKTAYKKPNRYLTVRKQIESNKQSEDVLKRQQMSKFSFDRLIFILHTVLVFS